MCLFLYFPRSLPNYDRCARIFGAQQSLYIEITMTQIDAHIIKAHKSCFSPKRKQKEILYVCLYIYIYICNCTHTRILRSKRYYYAFRAPPNISARVISIRFIYIYTFTAHARSAILCCV